MFHDSTTDFSNLLADKIRLPGRIEDIQAAYGGAKPFSHVVIDNMVPEQTLDSLLTEMQNMSRDQWRDIEQDSRDSTVRMRSAVAVGVDRGQLVRVDHWA